MISYPFPGAFIALLAIFQSLAAIGISQLLTPAGDKKNSAKNYLYIGIKYIIPAAGPKNIVTVLIL